MTQKAKQKGFTIMELVIVAVIISIGAALAVPKFHGVISRLRFKSTGRNIVSTLRLARANAVSKRAQFGVYFDLEDREYVFYKDIQNLDSYAFNPGDSIITLVTLAPNLSFDQTSFENGAVVFFSDGAASSTGSVDLCMTDEYDYLTIDILASTGRVKLIKHSHDY